MEQNFRLKVELNSSIKFYAVTPSNVSIAVLRKKISIMLLKSYNLAFANYTIRTVDGYDILDYYNVKDVLENEQTIILDPFSRNTLSSNIPLMSSVNETVALKAPSEKIQSSIVTKTPNKKESKPPIQNIVKEMPTATNTTVSKVPGPKTASVPSKDEVEIKRSKSLKSPRIVLEKTSEIMITPMIETIPSFVNEITTAQTATMLKEAKVLEVSENAHSRETVTLPSKVDGETVNLLTKTISIWPASETVDLRSKLTTEPGKENYSEPENKKNSTKSEPNDADSPATTDIASFKPLKKRKPVEDLSLDL